MARPDNRYDELARDAADRLSRDRSAVEQLTMLPDERAEADQAPARRTRGKAKAASQMAEWLAANGYRLPQETLAQLATLRGGETVLDAAKRETEAVLLWAFDGSATRPTPAQRLATFQGICATRLRAAEALLPYVAPKVTPDLVQQIQTTLLVPVPAAPQPAAPGAGPMRDVTPIARRIAPPPMPHQIEQNQGLSDEPDPASDGRGENGEATD